MPAVDCVNTCGAGCGTTCVANCGWSCGVSCGNDCTGYCGQSCGGLCADICSSSCKSECGSGCASSSTTPTKFIDPDHIDKDFMLDTVRNIMRYIILLGNRSDIITSSESLFSVVIEPMYYVVTVSCINTDPNPIEIYPSAVVDFNGGILHKYEYVFRINRVNNETTVTIHDYIKFYRTYEETIDETVGNITIRHHAGSRVVENYSLYTEPTTDLVSFYYSGIHADDVEIHHAIGDPRVKYRYYTANEYDDQNNPTNRVDDIYVDENGLPIVEYVVSEYNTYWVKINSNTYRKDKDTDSWILVVDVPE